MRTLAGLTLLSLALSGCATSNVNLYPIADTDIARLKSGVPYTPKQDGYFLSDMYMGEVLEAKVEAIKKAS